MKGVDQQGFMDKLYAIYNEHYGNNIGAGGTSSKLANGSAWSIFSFGNCSFLIYCSLSAYYK